MRDDLYTNTYMDIKKLFPGIAVDKSFRELDIKHYEQLSKRGIYIWGTGNTAKQLTEKILGLNIVAFVDNYPKVDFYEYGKEKIPIIPPSCMKDSFFIVIASIYYDEIKKQLELDGKKEYIDFISYSYLYPRPSDLANVLLHAPVITNWKCIYPYQTVRLEEDGGCGFCICNSWLKVLQGNAFLQPFLEIENSIIMKLFRYSIESGKYCFCDTKKCSGIKRNIGNFKNENYEWEMIRKNTKKTLGGAIASFDLSCNLFCESCRNERFIIQNEKLEFLKEYFIKEIMPHTSYIVCAGAGEVFLSKYYQEIIDCGDVQDCMIISNGILMDKERIEKFSNHMKGNVIYAISIDAAKKETYQKLRRGGNYDRLIKNLFEMSKKVKQGKAKALMLNFVISRKNYKEIMEFVKLGEQVGANILHFTKIENWGVFTNDEFDYISMFDEENKPKNTEIKKEIEKLQEVEKMKIFILDVWGAVTYAIGLLQ